MAGIMHFSNFFRFMEVAETAFLRERGMTVSWSEGEERQGFPRVSVSCDYLKPARFEELLDIEVTVEKVGTKSVTYRFDFSCNGTPIAVGRMSSVYCRSNREHQIESLEIPAEMRVLLEG
jgi:YbgC/YbaW family acyl-CoA thioester hydrolase